MALFQPTLPPYDFADWRARPFPERLKMVCQSWALQGYGTPVAIYAVYILKIAFYIWAWSFFCSFTPGLGKVAEVGDWMFTPIAFQKAVLWSMAFEVLGLGCGSGPLTGRYVPPIGGVIHFLWPGTIKMPLIEGLPVLGGQRRTWLDVALYAAYLVFLFRALVAPELTLAHLLPTVILLPVLGLTDKTIFLASRAEHYLTALVCFCFAADWIAGSKVVWIGVWMWAATSKLNRHFPAVVCVMVSNSPFTFGAIRKRMYRDFPNDLRPSKLAHVMAHAGTFTEFTFPILLLLGDGGTLTIVGLTVMFLFHCFITGNVPMGVPIEWNVMMVYGAFFLFGQHADVSVLSIGSPWLVVYLVLSMFVMQVIGNFVPSRVSFLCSMRYYAGNWAYSVWLFKNGCDEKLDQDLTKAAKRPQVQLAGMYDELTTEAILSKVMGFRAMHLHGRVLHDLLPMAVDDLEDYAYVEGELVAGLALGWNFGDGHLHDEQLLRTIQTQCDFEPGQLRCIMVESEPMLGGHHTWRIVDAATGIVASGKTDVGSLVNLQPWPEASFDRPAADA